MSILVVAKTNCGTPASSASRCVGRACFCFGRVTREHHQHLQGCMAQHVHASTCFCPFPQKFKRHLCVCVFFFSGWLLEYVTVWVGKGTTRSIRLHNRSSTNDWRDRCNWGCRQGCRWRGTHVILACCLRPTLRGCNATMLWDHILLNLLGRLGHHIIQVSRSRPLGGFPAPRPSS